MVKEDPSRCKRLEVLLDSASKHASHTNAHAVQVCADIAKEKTQYFEKIALAAGGTIALVVSFLGSHVLRPTWLLRSALVMFVLAMVGAMFRNWKYPYYLMAVHLKLDFEAKREKERCRREYIVHCRPLDIDTGGPIDRPAFEKSFGESDKVFEEKIDEFKDVEHSSFAIVKYTEWLTLTLMVLGMGMLVGLAFKNF